MNHKGADMLLKRASDFANYYKEIEASRQAEHARKLREHRAAKKRGENPEPIRYAPGVRVGVNTDHGPGATLLATPLRMADSVIRAGDSQYVPNSNQARNFQPSWFKSVADKLDPAGRDKGDLT